MRSTRLKVIVPLLTAAVALTLLTGCNVGPKYKRPAYQAPEAFRGADETQVATNTQASLGDKTWPEAFQEPELQALIKEAMGNSFDVRIAAQRILE
ncbi:MAG: transporter, partial [Acidobacteria bacterium]|nr:transporter [Acidobacteriota bacterium]